MAKSSPASSEPVVTTKWGAPHDHSAPAVEPVVEPVVEEVVADVE